MLRTRFPSSFQDQINKSRQSVTSDVCIESKESERQIIRKKRKEREGKMTLPCIK